jgi:tetratricopeptide (TPR) repeat protein
MTRGGGRRAVAVYHGPLTLYLAGRTAEAVEAGARASEMARVSRDSEFIIYGQSHYALALAAIGRYGDARRVFEEARQFGRKYGVLPPLARATAMEAGMLLALSDFDGAEALQSEAREMARSLAFAPTLVSAGIDLLLTLARRHEPGRAEQLLAETAASVMSTPGWHEWLWKLRLSEARAELALARGEFDLAISEATAAIDQSRARSRPKYEVLALVTRAVAHDRSNRTPAAAIDLQSALTIARSTLDPALQLRVIASLLDIEGTDALAAEAQSLRDRIRAALPDEAMRRRFDTSNLGPSVR